MNKSFTYFKDAFLETLDDQIMEEMCTFRTSDNPETSEDHYEEEFQRLKAARLREFERNSFAHYEDWLDSFEDKYSWK